MADNKDMGIPDDDDKDDGIKLSMKDIQHSTRFKKDYKRLRLRGANLGLLREVIVMLQKGERLSERYQNHQLEGKWKDSFDCHIQPDWILIYRTTEDAVILLATGTHSDLFKQ